MAFSLEATGEEREKREASRRQLISMLLMELCREDRLLEAPRSLEAELMVLDLRVQLCR